MTTEIVDLPINSMVIFHSFLYVYQMVSQPAIEVGDINIHRMKLDESARPGEVGIETVFSFCLSWGFQNWHLVGGIPTPLKNISQMGWWNSQYMEKKNMFQTTNQHICELTNEKTWRIIVGQVSSWCCFVLHFHGWWTSINLANDTNSHSTRNLKLPNSCWA